MSSRVVKNYATPIWSQVLGTALLAACNQQHRKISNRYVQGGKYLTPTCIREINCFNMKYGSY